MARSALRRISPGQTLQATALVHEAYLRLAGSNGGVWEDRQQFLAAAAVALRDIAVEEARRKASLKRGGNRERLAFDAVEVVEQPPPTEVLAVREAVARLEQISQRKAQVVSLRYFARFSVQETARALGICAETVRRESRFARAWLEREIERP